MSFDALLGNEQLRRNLASAVAQGRISHFYLISGPRGSGKHTLARLLAAAVLCRGEKKPCMRCPSCRKVMQGLHPDFITVDDTDKKTVSVELVRRAREDVYILPNESERKVYLFPRAHDMLAPAQNALLKLLEEPPEYAVFLLLTENPDALLPTVRSRCTMLSLSPLPEETALTALRARFPQQNDAALRAAITRGGGYLGQAEQLLGESESEQTRAFASAFASGEHLAILQLLVPMEKWKRDALAQELSAWIGICTEALAIRCGLNSPSQSARTLASRGSDALLQAARILNKALDYTRSNVSPAAICGDLAFALRIERK